MQTTRQADTRRATAGAARAASAPALFPGEGYRYQDTVYDDAWLDAKGLRLDVLPRGPVEWDRPHGPDAGSCFRWGRRACAEVVHPPAATALELVPA